MANAETPIKKEKSTIPTAENKKGIENHNKIATHLETAANLHKEAAKHHGDGNHEKAAESTIKAQGHTAIANEHLKDVVKQHALIK